MSRTSAVLLLCGTLALAAVGVGWWLYRPTYRLHQAEQALAGNDLARAAALLQSFTADARARTLYERVLRRLVKADTSANRWDDVDRVYSRWLDFEPDRLDIRLARGQNRLTMARETGGSTAPAVDDFRSILNRDPDNYEARLSLAQTLLSDAHMAEAQKELLVCRRLRPGRAEPLIGLASCAIEDRNWTEAHDLLRQALERDPGSATALTMKGDVCLQQQQYAQAAEYFREALKWEPLNKNAHLKLAQALRYGGRDDEARREERAYEKLDHAEKQASP